MDKEDKVNQKISRKTRSENRLDNPTRASENQTSRFDLESILWIAVSGVVMYYTDFWNFVLHDFRVKRTWLYSAVSLYSAALVIIVYCMVKMPGLSYDNWLQKGPRIVPLLTVTSISASVCLTVSLWPVWGLITPFILFSVLMGVIACLVTIS